MTRTQKRIQNLWKRLGQLIEQRAVCIKRHKQRRPIEREMQMIRTKIIRLERCV